MPLVNNIAIKVSVIGLGYVGLPLALVMAENGAQIFGFDTDKEKINLLISGQTFLDEKELISLWSNNYRKMFFSDELKEADVYFIAVPTPLLKNETNCDISFVDKAVKSVSKILKPNNIVILVSTCPVGTTNNISDIIYENSGLKAGRDYDLAYCPERLYPGDTYKEIINNDHIIGGFSEKSGKRISDFYIKFISHNTQKTNSKIAELAKLAENSYRDINIAFANELAEITFQNKEKIKEVINLANLHPRVNILQPGIGVGGHCLPIDPWFLINKYQKNNISVIRASRQLNDQVPLKIASRIIKIILQYKKNENNKSFDVAFLGYTYKPNIADLRESPAKLIIKEIKSHNFSSYSYDPFVDSGVNENEVLENLNKSQIIVLLVEHKSLESICKKTNYIHWMELI